MASPDLTVRGAYSLGTLIQKNHISKNASGERIYVCSLSVSAETKYEQGSTGVFQRERRATVEIDLVGADGHPWKESMWTGPEYEGALAAAATSAELFIKTNYGTGA